MIPEHRTPTSPGEMLQEEFLAPLGLTQTAFARHIGVPIRRVNEIVRKRRTITPETAQLFAAALGTTAQFWMNAQSAYDLATHRIHPNVARLEPKPTVVRT